MQNVYLHWLIRSSSFKRSIHLANHLMSNSKYVIPQMTNPEFTAGIIVIGDEILKGQVADTNIFFITKHLFAWGVKVRKISVIPDDLDSIAKEVSEFSTKYMYVITTGGVGPTHDDLTFEGVGKAFNEPLEPHPHLVELCLKYFGTDDLKSPKLKMAMVPKSAQLIYGEDKSTGKKIKYPLIRVGNTYMFPGVPSILEHALPLLKDHFKNAYAEIYTKELYVSEDEVLITDILNNTDQKFKRQVTLGSYPDFINSYYKVKLTLESQDKEQIDAATRYLEENLPSGSIVHYDKNPMISAVDQVYGLVNNTSTDEYTQKVKHAVGVIEEALERYRLDETCIGFNGGKDCTVLLHLVHAVVKRKFPEYDEKLKALYIRSKLPFPEVEKFIQITRDRYNLELIRFNGCIKDSLNEFKNQHPAIKVVLMGTRIMDPYSCHLQSFSMTDSDWPQFMRANPLLNWTYSDIWKFLRSLCLPYCSLYDRGYTSMGSMNNTHPNPSLQYLDGDGVVRYLPAYKLDLDSKERDGRNT